MAQSRRRRFIGMLLTTRYSFSIAEAIGELVATLDVESILTGGLAERLRDYCFDVDELTGGGATLY